MDEKTAHTVTTDLAPVHTNDSTLDVLEVTYKRPYGEAKFVGTYAAVCLGALAVYGGFVMPATSLALINEDIGPSGNIIWVALAWTLCLAVGYTLVGRLSDIFGRRWFFIGASLMATVGCILGGTAQNVNQLIGANVLNGLAAAAQLSFNYIITELVPMKDRFYVLALIFLFAMPFSAFGPVISRLLIVHTEAGWRWGSTSSMRTAGPKMQELKDLDIGGIILYIAGLLLFLMGLSWGGTLYPWGSTRVITTLIVGAVTLVVFVCYESYMPLKRPLVPMHLFRNRDYCVLTTTSFVGGMLYYSLNVIYPTMIATLFTTDIVKGGLLSCAIGGGVGAGQFSSSLWATPGGNFRWKLFFSVIACTTFTAGMAGAKTQHTATALIVLASYFIGALESLAGVAVTMVISDQKEIGAATGVYGSLRSVGGVLATTIFSTILMNRVKDNTEHHVVPALIESGLPLTSVEPLLLALQSGSEVAIEKVPGVTTEILGVAATTLRAAYANAFVLLFLVSLAFGGCSIIASYFTPAIEHLYTDEVMRRLDGNTSAGRSQASTAEKEAHIEHRETV